jgi:hypothetical protein
MISMHHVPGYDSVVQLPTLHSNMHIPRSRVKSYNPLLCPSRSSWPVQNKWPTGSFNINNQDGFPELLVNAFSANCSCNPDTDPRYCRYFKRCPHAATDRPWLSRGSGGAMNRGATLLHYDFRVVTYTSGTKSLNQFTIRACLNNASFAPNSSHSKTSHKGPHGRWWYWWRPFNAVKFQSTVPSVGPWESISTRFWSPGTPLPTDDTPAAELDLPKSFKAGWHTFWESFSVLGVLLARNCELPGAL